LGLEFEHRSSDSPLIERVWRSWSLNTTTMNSVARAHCDFVFWEGRDGVHAGIQGPESRASQAPVPADAEFIGIRLALGTILPARPASTLVDRFVEFPVESGWFHLGGDRIRMPRFDDAEEFIALLVCRDLLLPQLVRDGALTDRTRQRQYLAAVGLPRRTVLQIERANDAAVRLRQGQPPAAVAQESGYFDQPHLARSLRRFIGPSATELAKDSQSRNPLSLLYKTKRWPDR
jgi:AraC-like DNA-binding protein